MSGRRSASRCDGADLLGCCCRQRRARHVAQPGTRPDGIPGGSGAVTTLGSAGPAGSVADWRIFRGSCPCAFRNTTTADHGRLDAAGAALPPWGSVGLGHRVPGRARSDQLMRSAPSEPQWPPRVPSRCERRRCPGQVAARSGRDPEHAARSGSRSALVRLSGSVGRVGEPGTRADVRRDGIAERLQRRAVQAIDSQ